MRRERIGDRAVANKRKLVYIAGFVAICWIVFAAMVGLVLALAHVLKSTNNGVTLFLILLYSCLFGVLGWQVYGFRRRPDGWPSVRARGRSRKRTPGTTIEKDESAAGEGQSGWKRS